MKPWLVRLFVGGRCWVRKDALRAPMMDGRADGAAQLPAHDKYAQKLASWRAKFDVWRGQFDAWIGEGVLPHPPAPPKTTSWPTKDMVLAAQRDAAYDSAKAEQGAAYAQWEARNAQRQKKRKQRNRPDDDGVQATGRRLESEELLDRHRAREQERRSAAQPEPTAEEVQDAERAIKYGTKRRDSAKALAAAQANLRAANDANEIRFLVRDLIWQLENDAEEAAAAEKERSKRRSNPLYALRCDFRLLLAARRPELSCLGEVQLREAMQQAIVAATGSAERPAWACQWPARYWWCDSEREADNGIYQNGCWDYGHGSWCGADTRWDGGAFDRRCEKLRMEFLRHCLPPNAAAAASNPQPDAADDEELTARALREYPDHWRRYFGESALESPAGEGAQAALLELGELAPRAHSWAAEVLRQMAVGARVPLPLSDGRWCCDFGVRADLIDEREPIPLKFVAAAEWAQRYYFGAVYDGPLASQMPLYYEGKYVPPEELPTSAKEKPSRDRPGFLIYTAAREFGEFQPEPAYTWRTREQPFIRYKLRLKPELMTRGSHCCLATPELSRVRGAGGAPPCDCVGRGGESYGKFDSASLLKISSSYMREQREQEEAVLRKHVCEHPPGAHLKSVERFSDGVNCHEWHLQQEAQASEARRVAEQPQLERREQLKGYCFSALKRKPCTTEDCPFAHNVPEEVQRLARTTCLKCFKCKGKHAFVAFANGQHPSSDLCDCRIECFLCNIDCCNHLVPEGQRQDYWRCKVCSIFSPRARDGSQRCQMCVDRLSEI